MTKFARSAKVEELECLPLAATMPCLRPHQAAPAYTAWDEQLATRDFH